LSGALVARCRLPGAVVLLISLFKKAPQVLTEAVF